jgi:hypothetical protein
MSFPCDAGPYRDAAGTGRVEHDTHTATK